jgi:uncharacterized membrane protein
MMGFGLIWVILIVLAVAYFTGWRPENVNLGAPRKRHAEQTVLEILRERYARGEVTKTEFERIRADLKA